MGGAGLFIISFSHLEALRSESGLDRFGRGSARLF